MQTLFLRRSARNKMKAYTHTPFLNTFRVVHEQKDKTCLRNTNILNDLRSFHNSSILYLWLNTKHLRSDDLPQDKSCKETRAYARGSFGVNPPLELDILQKRQYLRKEINCFYILFAC